MACGGNSRTDDSVAKAGAAGAQTGVAGGTNSAGSATSGGNTAGEGGSVGRGGGSAGKGGEPNNGGGAGSGGAAAGAAGASAGSNAGGAQGIDATACKTRDDCVIATVFTGTGCCARTDCGSAFNRDWVLKAPCASSDPAKDPVPASCSQGCAACPASHCEEPVGVECNAGKCQPISLEGPCSTDADCVLAIDYTTVLGSCCGCAEVVSKAFEAVESCVELTDAAKPGGCMSSACTIDCAACTVPQPTCTMGRCAPR